MRILLPAFAILSFTSCATRHAGSLPIARPNPSQGGSVDLLPQTELRIENAYYQEGAPKHGLSGFLGTEIARYQVRRRGLQFISAGPGLTQRPRDQPPVQELLRPVQMRYRYYRFFYAVVFYKRKETSGAVLLGSGSMDELERLGAQLLSEPDSICSGQSSHCSVFPQACTVSLEIEIVVNGAARTVPWGSLLASISPGAQHFELLRRSGRGLDPVTIDPSDPNALRLPLLPGDRVSWD